MKFEWDENKNSENIRKHGFDFADAHQMFEKPLLARLDDRENYGEDRWIGIGTTANGIVVILVFTEREEETIRIISMRKATKNERTKYEKAIKDRLGKN
ncbi:MAG: BrnT family toxin [Deltaproteobacteria bacterium]|nr:BrnT family toxin [Deltaproteobacteria bacterium]